MIDRLLLVGLLLLSGVAVSAQEVDLSSAREEWRAFRALPKPDQRRIYKVYMDFEKLSPALQDETRDWAKRWLALAPQEKALIRHRLQRWERMSPEEKQSLRDRWLESGGPGSGS